ncbi:ABC transporter substrate-binding protein [Dermatobacter hominis]|uniref:ABC transporter substrate-binding protein n=1 Tax=Dermatobacter hominis TaxID=2884263 RepID=UPI001D12A7A3|nr:ABC transporter substrate-binding protein [Dermatobacter hominis]UDY37638.1 ABC transporter substrate-binding protein [Dermatobacter hominis]
MTTRSRGPARHLNWIVALAAALALVAAACADDDKTAGEPSTDRTTAGSGEELLGPVDQARGEPVKVGLVSEGVTQAFDNTDELRAGEAAAEYFNEHQGGIARRPIELVTCEINGDPSRAQECASKMITEQVVAVTLSQSGYTDTLWKALHSAGIPTFFTQASGVAIESDAATSFVVLNPVGVFFGLPVAVAEAEKADNIAFVVIDVPQAVEILEGPGVDILERSGLEHEVVRVPIGTPDMTPQMQQVVDSGAKVVQVIGNDSFCIAAFQGLESVGYTGSITAVNQCITDATRTAMPGQLGGINLLATLAVGAVDDPTYELYLAVMGAYAPTVEDLANATTVGGYAAVAALATALQDLSGDVTPETVASAIKKMPESDFPAGGGIRFRCGGSAMPASPAVCTNQWLRTVTDADGNPTEYTVEDSSNLFQ